MYLNKIALHQWSNGTISLASFSEDDGSSHVKYTRCVHECVKYQNIKSCITKK